MTTDAGRRSGTVQDLLLLLSAAHSANEVSRLRRISARLVMLAAVVVAALGVLAGSTAGLVEGTLVVLLAFAAGWLHSRIAAVLLTLLMAMGLATGLAAGATMPGLLFQVLMLGLCLRLTEAVFKQSRLPASEHSNPQT